MHIARMFYKLTKSNNLRGDHLKKSDDSALLHKRNKINLFNMHLNF